MENLTELKQKHDQYIARFKAKGARILAYRVPCCNGVMEDRAAPAGETWDTLATCPHCGSLYMKITTVDAINGLLPEAA